MFVLHTQTSYAKKQCRKKVAIQKKFYLAVMEERYEKVLKPTCHKIMGLEMEAERQTESRKERRCR